MQRADDARRIDGVCDDFESAWRANSNVRLEAFLGTGRDHEVEELFPWLLALEIALRRSAGELVAKAEYLHRFSKWRDDVEKEFVTESRATIHSQGSCAEWSASTERLGADDDQRRSRLGHSLADGASDSCRTPMREIAGYEVLGEIGRGGMGIVYRARQPKLDREVAIKVIRAGEFAREADRQRFRIEAAAAAQLDHPGIVPVFEVGEWHEQLFYVMAFVAGETLASRLSRGPLSAEQSARIVVQISEAVQAAHSKGIVHRDLKPSNILLDEADRPRVADFSLALRLEMTEADAREPRAPRRDPTVTMTGQIVGTPNYMSPEQASARAELIGVRSDVYSLGAILYALLTGRPPFQAENPLDTLQQVREHEPVAPRKLNPQIARDLETITLKCLEKEPQRRYATAQELADELQRFLEQRPILARPIGVAGRAWRWAKRQPAVAAGVVVSALLTLGLIVGATVAVTIVNRKNSEKNDVEAKLKRVETSERNALAAQQAAEHSESAAKESETRATDKLYQSLLVSARSSATASRTGRRFESLNVIREAAAIRVSEELRDLALLALSHADIQPDIRVPVYRGDVHSFVADRELQRSASLGSSGVLRVRNIADDAITHEFAAPIAKPGFSNLQFSPTGDSLVVIWNSSANTPERAVTLWKLSSQRIPWELRLPRLRDVIEFSPDGRWLLFSNFDQELLLYDVATQQRHVAWKVEVPPVLAVFSPDSRQLAITNRTGPAMLMVYDVATQQVVSRAPHPAGINSLDWHPDGNRIATAGADGIVRVIRSDTGQVALSSRPDRSVHNVKYSHDGNLLISNSVDYIHTVWWARSLQPQFQFPGPPNWIRFRSDDQRFGWLRNGPDLLLTQVTTVPAVRRFSVRTDDRRAVMPPALRLDGRYMATSNDRETLVWDTRQGRLIAEIAEAGAQPQFDRASGDLLLQSPSKLRRWRFADQNDSPAIPARSASEGSSTPAISDPSPARRAGAVLLVEIDAPKLIGQESRASASPVKPGPRTRAVSEDGKWTAFTDSAGRVVLAESATNRTIARFEQPLESPIADVRLSQHGEWLVVQNQLGDSSLYDLRTLRQQLQNLNLASDWPEDDGGMTNDE